MESVEKKQNPAKNDQLLVELTPLKLPLENHCDSEFFENYSSSDQ